MQLDDEGVVSGRCAEYLALTHYLLYLIGIEDVSLAYHLHGVELPC